jgi:acid-sensing ion channel 5
MKKPDTNKNTSKQLMEFRKGCVELLKVTTCHGLPNLARTDSWFMRFAWLLVFSLCLIYSIQVTVVTLLNFAKFNVLIKYELVQEFSNFEMPTVSFCSLNPFDFSNRTYLTAAHSFLAKNYPGEFFYTENNHTLCMKEMKDSSYPNWQQTLPKYGMALDKMIISCTFNGQLCNLTSNFVQNNFSVTTLGRCYSFNLNGTSLQVKKAGMPSGLQTEIFLGEPEMQPCWKTSRGLAVVVHNRSNVPLFSEEQLKVQPGVETSIILGVTKYSKLPFPYSTCINDLHQLQNENAIDYIIKKYGIYTQKRCLIYCGNKTAYDKLLASCLLNLTNSCSSDKLQKIADERTPEFFDECAESQCPIECSKSEFTVVSAFSEYPSLNYGRFLAQNPNITNRFTYFKPADLTPQIIKESMLKLNVYFQSINVHVYSETPEIDLPGLLANVGGTIGIIVSLFF